jgi:hypothetical protein
VVTEKLEDIIRWWLTDEDRARLGIETNPLWSSDGALAPWQREEGD